MASTRRTPQASACVRKSVDVSTSTLRTAPAMADGESPTISIRIDGRVRRSRGSGDRQTAQSHPIIGTPCEVPVRSSVIVRLTDASAAVSRFDEPQAELVKDLLEHLTLFGRQVAPGLLLEQRENLDHLGGAVEVRLAPLARHRIDEIAEMDRG